MVLAARERGPWHAATAAGLRSRAIGAARWPGLGALVLTALVDCAVPDLDAASGDAPGGPRERSSGADASQPAQTDQDASTGDAGSDAEAVDATVVVAASSFIDGVLGGSSARPDAKMLLPLPGGGVGGPVLTSNNPEIFTGNGVLYTNATSPTRGGTAMPLAGDFGVYLHHLNQAASTKWVSILVTNPNASAVTVSLRGSGYSQDETGGLGLGTSPDYRVSNDWIVDKPKSVVNGVSIPPKSGAVLWAKSARPNREIDGRFALASSAPVLVYVVATDDGSLQKALDISQPIVDAPGDYRVSGTPPPPFGREAGIYAHDTWRTVLDAVLPQGPKHVAFMVNTATGGGLPQVQAFPALTHYTQSAAEAVGMYGNVYDLDVGLRNDAPGASARRVRVAFHSLANGSASRWWDGVALVDGLPKDIRHVPGSETTTLFDGMLAAGEIRRVHMKAMVPGLAAIPQALSIESFD